MAAATHRSARRWSTSPQRRGSRGSWRCGTCGATRSTLRTTTCSVGPRIDSVGDDEAIRERVSGWLEERRSLLAAVRSQVLPEADVVLMNPLHPDATRVPPLVTRPFSFSECLHAPPMLERYP